MLLREAELFRGWLTLSRGGGESHLDEEESGLNTLFGAGRHGLLCTKAKNFVIVKSFNRMTSNQNIYLRFFPLFHNSKPERTENSNIFACCSYAIWIFIDLSNNKDAPIRTVEANRDHEKKYLMFYPAETDEGWAFVYAKGRAQRIGFRITTASAFG